MNGNLESVKVLLDAKVSANVVDNYGKSALERARSSGNADVVC